MKRLIVLLALLLSANANAATITLNLEPPVFNATGPGCPIPPGDGTSIEQGDIDHYTATCNGPASAASVVVPGTQTTATIDVGNEFGVWLCTVTATNIWDKESCPSNEVQKTANPPIPKPPVVAQ